MVYEIDWIDPTKSECQWKGRAVDPTKSECQWKG
jgi:hypothetical protein